MVLFFFYSNNTNVFTLVFDRLKLNILHIKLMNFNINKFYKNKENNKVQKKIITFF